MKRLAIRFLSELSATWLKRRLTATLPADGVHSSQLPSAIPSGSGSRVRKRDGQKPVMRPRPPSSHDIASNM